MFIYNHVITFSILVLVFLKLQKHLFCDNVQKICETMDILSSKMMKSHQF